MIRLEGVSKSFGDVRALAPLDLEIPKGEWLGVFGRNGSGKTSLLRILVGLSRPSGGRVLIDGREPSAREWLELRSRLGFMPERISFHGNLTATRTLNYYARLKGVALQNVAPLLEDVGLTEAADRRLKGYSKGMLQRLNLAQALLGDPELLILDEPLEGLDPHGIGRMFELLRRTEGRTVVLSSHQLPRVSAAVDRVCVLSDGHVRALGSEAELIRDRALPFRVTVTPTAESNGLLESSLRALGAVSVRHRQGRLELAVPQSSKMRFFFGLRELDKEIQDLRVEEPTFEEVFLETD